MPLTVTPVEAKLCDDRIEFGCPRSTCDHGGAAPLDALSSLLPPYESSVEQAQHGQCRNELFVVHDRLPLASSVVLPLSSPQVDEPRGSGLDCPMAVQPVDHLSVLTYAGETASGLHQHPAEAPGGSSKSRSLSSLSPPRRC